MKSLYRSLPAALPAIALTLGLALGGAALNCAGAQSYSEGDPYPTRYSGLRGLVDRTQSDLREAAALEHGKAKERERYRSAQGHLSTFDRHLVKGHFDRSELDKSRGEIKSILDHNVLPASSRDALLRDVEELTGARDRRY